LKPASEFRPAETETVSSPQPDNERLMRRGE
jgi:hypothetical protein